MIVRVPPQSSARAGSVAIRPATGKRLSVKPMAVAVTALMFSRLKRRVRALPGKAGSPRNSLEKIMPPTSRSSLAAGEVAAWPPTVAAMPLVVLV